MNVYARRIPQAIAHPSSAANESPGWSGRQPPPTGAESASRLATSRGRLGHARARVGPQNARRVAQKSGRVALRAWPSRGGLALGRSGDFVGPTRRSPKGDSGRHRGDSDPPGPTRGADSAHAPGPLARPSGTLTCGESPSASPGPTRRAATRPMHSRPARRPTPHSAPRHYRARRHFLCVPFLQHIKQSFCPSS